jgi:O-antigen ligase
MNNFLQLHIVPFMKERMNRPVETFCIFAPMISFFLPMDLFLIISTLACLLIVLNVKEFIKVVLYQYNYLLYIFAVYMTVLAAVNSNTLGLITSGFFYLVVIYVTYLRYKITKGIFEAMMILCGIGSIFSLYYCSINFYATSTYKLFAFFMKYIPIPYAYITKIAENIRSTSTFVDPNYYGTICATIAVISVYYILKSIRNMKHDRIVYRVKASFYTVVLIVNLYGLHLTQSRSSYLAFIAGVAFLILTYDLRLFIGLLVPLVLVVVFKFKPILTLFPRLDSVGGSAATRLSIYGIAMKEIGKNLFFGKGFYTFPLIYAKYSKVYTIHAHNMILELLLSSGLVGVSILALRLITLIGDPIRRWLKKDVEYMSLVLGTLALMIASGYTDAVILFPQCFILFSLVLMSLEVNHE